MAAQLVTCHKLNIDYVEKTSHYFSVLMERILFPYILKQALPNFLLTLFYNFILLKTLMSQSPIVIEDLEYLV